MRLTTAHKQALYGDGFVRLPGIVPSGLVNAALRAINGSLGSEGIHPDELVTFRSRSYCPELQTSQAITDLLHRSPLWEVAESAIGEGAIAPVNAGQIALRFPTPGTPHDPHAHIDGMYSPHNGVPKGTIANFTALVGVFLSDVPTSYAGNFTVWPGSHRQYEGYFREHGPDSLLNGMPDVKVAEPEQVTARAGDAVLAHYQLGHGIAGNASPHIRYAIFFRLSHVDHQSVRWECMTDIWREWAGMRDVVAVNAAEGAPANTPAN
ncbi:phytanoyl-CoA dioxygenase family protein [Actinopolymorpha singaporensis]|uniref:Phytanoyl-CoA dioxygenase (PhyH) n=1 Tax=Actinopolymorpha singaporensis TaxID=117157 RepID=A0A1H1YR10_9ACTN|nr:phytanoyl-CoA dioxygenase family protein [Actinopolymorpha singaporensis]SDT23888.1 Phytanoyl-CoA dioxygenase (PhyH) [Actinopolymorpha singaporensis]